MSEANTINQPLGPIVDNWKGAQIPPKTSIRGQYCVVEPLTLENLEHHANGLYDVLSSEQQAASFTYFSYGPFENLEDLKITLSKKISEPSSLFHVIIDLQTNKPIGLCAYLRITPEHGTIEVGHVLFSTDLKRTRVATEAMYLLMKRAFEELGYRRYEWKCNALSQSSREAALRLGFKFEGVFRQHLVFKNRSRNTAWFSILDREWPAVKERLKQLLAGSTASQVRPAEIKDIPGVISILKHNLISNKESAETETLEKTGFLINGFTIEDAKEAVLDKDNFIFIVADEEDDILGYTMGYHVNKLKSGAREKLAAVSSEMQYYILSEKTFYHKHVAKKSGKPGVGKQLLRKLLNEAKKKGYKHIICQIAKKPLENKISIAIHEKHGFECIGYNRDGENVLGVYLKTI